MIKALYTAATGMRVQQTNVDVIANNLANVNTTGFKRSQADFQDLMYVVQKEPGVQSANGLFAAPSGIQIGSGAELLSTSKIFSQGVLEPTGRDLDLAIEGDGFLVVDRPDGDQAFTRDGALRLDADGNLTTAQGYRLRGPGPVPVGTQAIAIGLDGSISVTDSDGVSSDLGQLEMVRFSNSTGLRAVGGNLFFQTDSSGQPITGVAGEDGFGAMRQSVLERSNVDVVREMVSLITAQRAYEINSRAIRAGDEMLSEINNLVR